MGIFQNSFFTLAGQKERLANAGNTILAAVGIKSGGVQANTSSSTVNKVLETAANHPFSTAGVVAAVANPVAAGNVVKSVATKAVSSFSSASLPKQAVVVGGGIVATNTLISSSKARSAVVSTPSSLANFGSNLGKTIDNPSAQNIINLGKENPYIAAGTALALGAASGVGIASIANIVTTAKNTAAVKANTAAAAAPVVIAKAEPLMTNPVAPTMATPAKSEAPKVEPAAPLPEQAGSVAQSPKKKSAKKKKKTKKKATKKKKKTSKKRKVYKKKSTKRKKRRKK